MVWQEDAAGPAVGSTSAPHTETASARVFTTFQGIDHCTPSGILEGTVHVETTYGGSTEAPVWLNASASVPFSKPEELPLPYQPGAPHAHISS